MKPRDGFRDTTKTIDFGKTLRQILKKRLIKNYSNKSHFNSLTLCGKVLRKMMRTSVIREKKISASTIFSRKKKQPETGNLKPVSLDFFLFKLFSFLESHSLVLVTPTLMREFQILPKTFGLSVSNKTPPLV